MGSPRLDGAQAQDNPSTDAVVAAKDAAPDLAPPKRELADILVSQGQVLGTATDKESLKAFRDIFHPKDDGTGLTNFEIDFKTDSVPEEKLSALRRMSKTLETQPGDIQKSDNRLKVEDLRKTFEAIFDKLDTSRSGEISLSALNKAIQDPRFTGQDAQALAAIYLVRDKLLGQDKESISKESLKKLDGLNEISSLLPTISFAQKVGSLLSDQSKFMFNADGHTKESLSRELDSPELTAQEKALIRQALNCFDDLCKLSGATDNVLDSRQLQKLSKIRSEDPNINMASEIDLAVKRVSQIQESGPHNLFGKDGPSVEAIQQGTVGDCNFLAPLASLAKVDPAVIKNMITDLGNGRYSVKFPGADKSVEVDKPTEAEMGLFNKGNENGSWAAVLEKAYGEYVRKNPELIRQSQAPCSNDAPAAECLSGGGKFESLQILTGKQHEEREIGDMSASDIGKEIQKLLDAKSIVVLASKPFINVDPLIQSSHMYSVVGLEKGARGELMVVLRDPQGKSAHNGNETLKIPVTDLRKHFKTLAFTRP